jgi:hypothetical protein
MTDPLTALRDVPVPARLSAGPIHARIDALAARAPRRRRKLPALSLLAVGAAAAAVVLTTGGTPTVQPAAATAATVLRALGRTAVAEPPARLGDGEYYAVRIHQYGPTDARTDVDLRTWDRGGKGRELALVQGKVQRDVALGTPAGVDTAKLPDPQTFPTEPKALAARLLEVTRKTQLHPGSQPLARDYLGTALSVMFTSKPTPPEVLRGIYDFLAAQPGVRLIGDVTDPLGRPGKAVAVDGDPDTQEGIGVELIVDPANGRPLAYVHYRDGDVDDPWLYTTRQEGVVKGTGALPG